MTNTTSNDNETPNNNNNNINSTTIIQDNIFHTGAVRLSTLHASTYHEDADNRSSDTDYLKKHLLGQEESLFDLEYLLSDSSTEDEKNKNSTKTTLTAMYPLTTNRIPIKLVYGKKGQHSILDHKQPHISPKDYIEQQIIDGHPYGIQLCTLWRYKPKQ
jgi:hypothetical protein